MLMRSLIVFLVVLNLGVGAWWLFHSPAPMPPDAPLPLGVARLQLASEVDADGIADVAAVAGEPPAAMAVCATFGPFAPDDVAAARAVLEARTLQVVPRRQEAGAVKGWRVYLPPFASVDGVEAAARRVADAGFSDYFIVRDGIEANSLALGRYGSEEGARRRIAELADKGVDARAAPIGSGAAEAWLDVEAAAGFDVELAESDAKAPGHRMLECPATTP